MSKHVDLGQLELAEGQIVAVDADGTPIALVRHEGQLHAFDAACTHSGAPLVEGTVEDGCLRCPWHGGAFDLKTGRVASPPPLRPLTCYRVSELDGSVRVELPDG